jgi:hypothetical protein
MPAPPPNAMLAMTVPALRADGLRDTPMRDIDDNEKMWYFRAALNVAALNCQDPQYFRIADDYNVFLKTHKRELDRVNRAVEDTYRKRYGSGSARIRDTENTQVYNFFAFPPVKSDFCQAALVLGQEAAAIPSTDLVAFSVRALPTLEGVFDRFYATYEGYQTDLQQWIALYGSPEMRAAQAARMGPANTGTVNAGVVNPGQMGPGQMGTGQMTPGQPATAPGAAPATTPPPVLPTILSNSGN